MHDSVPSARAVSPILLRIRTRLQSSRSGIASEHAVASRVLVTPPRPSYRPRWSLVLCQGRRTAHFLCGVSFALYSSSFVIQSRRACNVHMSILGVYLFFFGIFFLRGQGIEFYKSRQAWLLQMTIFFSACSREKKNRATKKSSSGICFFGRCDGLPCDLTSLCQNMLSFLGDHCCT